MVDPDKFDAYIRQFIPPLTTEQAQIISEMHDKAVKEAVEAALAEVDE